MNTRPRSEFRNSVFFIVRFFLSTEWESSTGLSLLALPQKEQATPTSPALKRTGVLGIDEQIRIPGTGNGRSWG